ncbi:MAG: FkbM family methyltransferase [Candidatus Omnitrophica bacterium]|nr:FkbM family methyltransferase [Candidatus Omnitrophota bacterium]
MLNYHKTRLYQSFSCFSTAFKSIKRNFQAKKFESEVSILNKFISKGSVCVDIGGAYGRYAFAMSKLVGQAGRIHSFEPGKYSFNVLSTVVKFCRLKNVTITKKALSNSSGSIKLFSPVKQSGRIGPSLAYIADRGLSDALSEEVEMTTLDEYCSKNNINHVDFIKCDTEGAELLAFHGAREMIAKCKPVVLSEVDKGHLSRHNHTPAQMFQFFSDMGYVAYIYRNSKFTLVNSLNDDANYFFVPSARENLA